MLSTSNLDLALEEKLDEADPLRHLRNDEQHDTEAILPAQAPSVHDQTIQLTFTSAATGAPDPLAVKLAIDASPGCGGVAWPAGEVLSRYIAQRGSLSGRKILELGSGTGLVGLVAGMLGARVWITDQAPLIDIMARNVALNGLSEMVTVLELNWGETVPQNLPQMDMVLAADCVYFEPAFPLLVMTLVDLTRDQQPEILFCYKKRRKADKRFFALLKKEFTWTEVEDDPKRGEYSKEAIYLLSLKRR